MTPREIYSLWVSLHLHFSTDYDIGKYQGKLKKEPDFTKCNDKFTFSKLSRHRDPKGLIIANLSLNPNLWARELFSTDANKRYLNWLKYREGLEYHFKEELKLLKQDSFKIINNQHPQILKEYIKGNVSIDTLVIVNDFIKFIDIWGGKLSYDPIVSTLISMMKKYKTFVKYDKNKVKKILKEWIEEHKGLDNVKAI